MSARGSGPRVAAHEEAGAAPVAAPGMAPSSAEPATLDAIGQAAPDWFDPVDLHTAGLLGDLAGEGDPAVRLALALASRQVRRGHVCLELPATAATPGPVDEEGRALDGLRWPDGAAWLGALEASPLVVVLPDGAPPEAAPPEPVPLLLEQPSGRLYLRRWWAHEAALARLLDQRARSGAAPDPPALAASLDRLFPPEPGPGEAGRRDQAAAVALAARRMLAVITGGPGTGKTSTVARLLALLVELALAEGRPAPRILLLAPTGKAAARMEESLRGTMAQLPVADAVRAAMPLEARTIHRALGPRPQGGWRQHSGNPLAADIVAVDEASMIDVALMHALVAALRPDTRLVILGDRDQLASVEAGAVLADICGPESAGTVPADPSGAAGLPPSAAPPPIAACIARLSYSFRFGSETGIGALARAVNAGDAAAALAVLADPEQGDVALVAAPPLARDGRLDPRLEALVIEGYGAYLEALAAMGDDAGAVPRAPDGQGGQGGMAGEAGIARALDALGRFRVLCAHRRGPVGVTLLGRAIQEALARSGRIGPSGEHWAGRPVLVTRNDPALGLYNGDLGLVAPDPAAGGRLRVFFAGPDGRPRAVAPPRLPPHETVFSMSIHKSQGSEFDTVAVVLPDAASPLLTRELLYTAVTRARSRVLLFGPDEAVRAAIARRALRASGLGARLWGA